MSSLWSKPKDFKSKELSLKSKLDNGLNAFSEDFSLSL